MGNKIRAHLVNSDIIILTNSKGMSKENIKNIKRNIRSVNEVSKIYEFTELFKLLRFLFNCLIVLKTFSES